MIGITSESEMLGDQKIFIKQIMKESNLRRISCSTLDPSYSGGNPRAIHSNEDPTMPAVAEEFPVLMPYAYANAKPSGFAAVAEVAPGEFILLGEIGSLPAGKLYTAGYWLAVTPGSIAVSTTAINTRAQRLHCDADVLVSSVGFEITAGGAGLVARVKLYGADGATLILDTGNVDCASTGSKNPSISPAVRITPGFYIVEVTASSGVSWRCADLMANFATVMNIGTTQRGTDHTMGTASAGVQFPIVKFQA
jgi:hypothetical protein